MDSFEMDRIVGLRRGEVKVVPHRSEWNVIYTNERNRIAAQLGAVALVIEHVGSTAVPELLAKPIIDIAIAVQSLDATSSWPVLLRSEDYVFFGDLEGRGEHFYAKGPDEMRTIYLHVVPISSSRWVDYLDFRALLRSRADMR